MNETEQGKKYQALAAMGRALVVCIIVNVVYLLFEILMGFRERSFGLLSDAGYNLGDVFSMALALVYVRQLGSDSASELLSYKRLTTVLVMAYTFVVLVAVGALVVTASARLLAMWGVGNLGFALKSEQCGMHIFWTALIGVVVNGLTALALSKRGQKEWNLRRAFRTLSIDTLISIFVALSGVVMHFRPQMGYIDPLLGIIVAVLMAISVMRLLRSQLSQIE